MRFGQDSAAIEVRNSSGSIEDFSTEAGDNTRLWGLMGGRVYQLSKGVISAVAVVFAVTVSIVTPVDAGTNFPAVKNYPAPNCPKPGRPAILSDHHYGGNVSAEAWPIAAEANQAYISAAQLAYAACIDAYVASAQADMALIRSNASTAASNFPALKDYPAPDCTRPAGQPALPDLRKVGPIAAHQALNDYRAQIANYEAHAVCMNAYTTNSQADMDLILNKLNKAAAGHVPAQAASRSSDWVTFKTGDSVFGPTQHQIDRNTILEEGPYRTFWTRIWIVPLQEALVYNDFAEERLIIWSQKFAVDCVHHKYGPNFIDSTDPPEASNGASVQTMTWVSLDEAPVITRVVCERQPVAATENVESRPLASSGVSLPYSGTNFAAIKDYPLPTCFNPGNVPILATGGDQDHSSARVGFRSFSAAPPPSPANEAANEYSKKIAQMAQSSAARLTYTACMDAYVASAQADLDLIRSKASAVSNFSALRDYPAPACGEPINEPAPPVMAPGRPLEYVQHVKNYNAQTAKYDVYASCMNGYRANAQADMDLIVEKVNKTVAERGGTK